MRFLAVDLPRSSVGDIISLYVSAKIDGVTTSTELNSLVLTDAVNLTITSACILLTTSLI